LDTGSPEDSELLTYISGSETARNCGCYRDALILTIFLAIAGCKKGYMVVVVIGWVL